MCPDDVEPLWSRRNDPDTARLQGWPVPYPRETAAALVHAMVDLDGVPPSDGWFQLAVDDATTATPVGDLALHLTFEGRCAEIGYTVAPEARGQHVATDAAARLARWLFDVLHVSRVGAEMHPDNVASARVAERIGMEFEGRTRNSYWVGHHNSDNVLYGMTPATWARWTDRARHEPDDVGLVEIAGHNLDAVTRLDTHRSQRRLVAPISDWFAVVHAPDRAGEAPRRPWIRAVVADAEIVGALLMSLPGDGRSSPRLWKVMIDRLHQGRGIGRRVIELAVDEARAWGARRPPDQLVRPPGDRRTALSGRRFRADRRQHQRRDRGSAHAVSESSGATRGHGRCCSCTSATSKSRSS